MESQEVIEEVQSSMFKVQGPNPETLNVEPGTLNGAGAESEIPLFPPLVKWDEGGFADTAALFRYLG